MSDFGTFRYTTKGIELEMKAQLGKTLEFTKFVLGDGYYTGDIRNITALVNPIRNQNIARLNIQTTTDSQTGTMRKKVQIGYSLKTQDISTGFYLREVGLYAKDPDDNQEYLVLYGNAGDTADYISPAGSSTISEKIQNINLYVSDTDNITAVIDTSVEYASYQDFLDYKDEMDANFEDLADDFQDQFDEIETEALAEVRGYGTRITNLENNSDLKGSFSIAVADWTSDTTWGDYTVKATITVTGVTANDIADIYFDSPENAGEIGATGVNTVANGIEIYAESTPESALTGKYKVAKVVVANE